MDTCNSESLKLLEDFVRDTGKVADAYTTLGGTYLDCQDFKSAREWFNKAIKSIEDNETTEAKLVAEYGLVVIDFLEGEIDEDEYKRLATKKKEELDEITSSVKMGQCNCTGASGRTGTWRKRVCIEPCP